MKSYILTILSFLVVSMFVGLIGTAQAETPTPYAVSNSAITAGDNVVTLSPSQVPVETVFGRRFRYSYGYYPYYYGYNYSPYYYGYYGSPYYRYSYRSYPYSYYSYGPYAWGW